ncbi:MAG TPA: hypothetical protein VGI22_28325, partial [Xanthobacteraceae bacterium]
MSIVSTALSDHEKRLLAVRARRARELIGGDKPIGKSKLYQLINSGELESYLDGCARMIVLESIERRHARLLAKARDEDGRVK